MYELGCSTLCLARMPRAEALRSIASMGFKWVDLGMLRHFTIGERPFAALHLDALKASEDDVRQVRSELDEAGLRLAAVNVWGGYLNLAWEREEGIAYLRRSVSICRSLGGYAVTVQSGKLLRGTDWRANVDYVAPAVRELSSYAEQNGVELHIESPHRETLTHDLRTTETFFTIVNHRNLYVTIDTSHIIVADENPVDVVRALGSRVQHVHLRDGAGSSTSIVPGRGEVDFPAFARALIEIGYQRPLIIELCQGLSEDYQTSVAQFMGDTRSAKRFMDEVLRVVSYEPAFAGTGGADA